MLHRASLSRICCPGMGFGPALICSYLGVQGLACDRDPTDTQHGNDPSAGGSEVIQGSGQDIAMPLIGNYNEIWGIRVQDYTTHEISEQNWKQSHYGEFPYTILYHVISFDPVKSYLIAQNDPVQSWFPGKWTRIDWFIANDRVYFCETLINGDSLEIAMETKAAKNNDLDRHGCLGFPWARMLPHSPMSQRSSQHD